MVWFAVLFCVIVVCFFEFGFVCCGCFYWGLWFCFCFTGFSLFFLRGYFLCIGFSFWVWGWVLIVVVVLFLFCCFTKLFAGFSFYFSLSVKVAARYFFLQLDIFFCSSTYKTCSSIFFSAARYFFLQLVLFFCSRTYKSCSSTYKSCSPTYKTCSSVFFSAARYFFWQFEL